MWRASGSREVRTSLIYDSLHSYPIKVPTHPKDCLRLLKPRRYNHDYIIGAVWPLPRLRFCRFPSRRMLSLRLNMFSGPILAIVDRPCDVACRMTRTNCRSLFQKVALSHVTCKSCDLISSMVIENAPTRGPTLSPLGFLQ